MDVVVILLAVTVVYFGLIILTGILRPLIFSFEFIFRFLNWINWFISNPFRFLLKNTGSSAPRGIFLALALSGVSLIWWLFAYIITTPIRFINAVYYDIVLFSAVTMSDSIQELMNPKRGRLGHIKGIKFLLLYLVSLPFNFIKMIVNSALYVADSLLMFGVSVVFPTLTMLHGTKFKEAGTKIAQSGDWLVGSGNYAGTGIYFGLNTKVAEYYAPAGENMSIVVVRVSLSFCKTIATLGKEKRELVGLGSSGEELAVTVKGLYSSVEHWRKDGNWWEYCILKPNKMGSFVNSWRIRPVALIKNGKISRIYSGLSHYSMGFGLVAGAFSWFLILVVFNFWIER